MEHTPNVSIFREVRTGNLVIGHMGPDLSMQGVTVLIDEISISADVFLQKGWEIVSDSLGTFRDRAVETARMVQGSQEEMRRAIRRDRKRQKTYLSLGVLRDSDESLLLTLCRGKRGHWHEVGRMTTDIPPSNEEFIAALEELGFFSDFDFR